MKDLFRLAPRPEYLDYSTSHLDKGPEYDDRFESRPGRALMWSLEQDVIARCIEVTQPGSVVDFACGTGRVAGFVAEIRPDVHVQGVDISESMLTVARQLYPQLTFYNADLRDDLAALVPAGAEMVTAFRFFANSDRSLRERTADQIAGLVLPGGYLLVNNHRNFWSIPYIAARAIGAPALGAKNGDIVSLFTARGFERLKSFSLGVWPQSESRCLVLPWGILRRLEGANLRTACHLHRLGYNTIWLLRKRAHST